MADDDHQDLDEALDELRRQREIMEEERDRFFTRIAGPLDRLSVIAGEPKRDPRQLVHEKQRELRTAEKRTGGQ